MTTKGCTVPDCTGKHMAKGLCGTHYRQRYRRKKSDDKYGITDESSTEKPVPAYTPPDEIKIGVQGPAAAPPVPVQPDQGPKPALVQYSVGTAQIELIWEWLNRAAPSSPVKLELTPVQRQQLDAAFVQAGLTTTNPWVFIITVVALPTILFCLLNYNEIKNGAKQFFDDIKNTFGRPKKVTPL